MIRARRFVWDGNTGRVVEVGGSIITPSFAQLHDRTKEEYKQDRNDRSGSALRQITLERAERRERAHSRYGTESRWKE